MGVLDPSPKSGSKLIHNLLTSRMVDFEIRCINHHFKVHRIVLASASPYFEAVCTGGFKEVEDGFVVCDTDPVLTAALILEVYTGYYINEPDTPFDTERVGQSLLDGAYCGSLQEKAFYNLNDYHPSVVHAQMYKVADFHQIDGLHRLAVARFKTAIQSPGLTIENLLDALEILYDFKLGYTPDDTLRAITVYTAQRTHHKLIYTSRFEELIRCHPEFALDYSTKYNRANWIYCPECKNNVNLEECLCGFSGVCGYRYCTTQDFSKMRCTTCDRKGHMMKSAPTADQDSAEEIEGMTVAEVLDEDKMYKTPISPSKKRKMKLASGA